MEAERVLFLVAAGIALGYVLLKKRRVDWFSIAAVAAAVYFLPGFVGYVRDPVEGVFLGIHGDTYLTYFLVFASITAGAIFHDLFLASPVGRVRAFSVQHDRHAPDLLLAISAISLVLAIIEMGDTLWAPEKSIAMQRQGRWMIAYEITTCLALLLYVAFGKLRRSILAGLLLLPSVFFGYRTAIVMTLISVLVMLSRKQGPIVLARRWDYGVIAVIALYGMMFLKQSLYALKYGFVTGQWALLIDTAKSEDSYVNAFFYSEPFLIQNTLNEVVRSGFSVGAKQLAGVAGALVPFGNELGFSDKGFNDYFQPALFSDVDFGLASNIWAQAYSFGSLEAVALFAAVFVATLTLINVAYLRSNGSLFAALALTGAYWGFYIHRNDVLYQFLLQRRVIVLFLVGWFASYLLSMQRRDHYKSPSANHGLKSN